MCRLSVGFSTTGLMVGTATSKNNVIVCDPSNTAEPVAQYDMLGYTFASMVKNPTSGTPVANMSVVQDSTSTTVRWVRGVSNGDVNGAQISTSGPMYVLWAIGGSNTFAGVPKPAMDSVLVDLSVAQAASATPSPSPSVGSGSTVAAAFVTSDPAYPLWYPVTDRVSLYWNRDAAGLFNFKAVLTGGVAWFSVGFGQNIKMTGPATAKNTAIICDLDGNASVPIGEYDMLGETMATIKYKAGSNLTNMSVDVMGDTVVMKFTRNWHNGDVNASQISLTGRTTVLWAAGYGLKYTDVPLPAMGLVRLDLSQMPSASPTPSATISVSPSATMSPSTTPSPYATSTAVSKKNGLYLYWNRNGNTFSFRAMLSRLAW